MAHVGIHFPLDKAKVEVFTLPTCQHAAAKCHRESVLLCYGCDSLDNRQSILECPHKRLSHSARRAVLTSLATSRCEFIEVFGKGGQGNQFGQNRTASPPAAYRKAA